MDMSMDIHMDTSIDIHMEMPMDIHMEMPIKSKVSKLGKWPEMLRAKAACVRSKRVAVRLYLMCDTDMIAYVIRSCRGWC